jgi:hypothetical protein
VPEILVAFHVLGASLVWVAVLRVWLSLHPVPAAEPTRADTPVRPPAEAAHGADRGAVPGADARTATA